MATLPWQVWALLSAVFAALTAVLGKVGVEAIKSDFATLIRTWVVVAFLSVVVVATQQGQPLRTVPARTYLFLAASGLATGLSWLCYYRALKLGEAARVAPLDKLSVVLVAVFSVALLGERLSLANWSGVALICGGAVLVGLR